MRFTTSFLLAALSCSAFSWGVKGHEIVNRRAAELMTGAAGKFFKANKDWLALHSIDADNAKRSDRSEGPRHYLDIDIYLQSPFKTADWSRAAWGKAHGADAFRNGEVPWAAANRYQWLVSAFKAKDKQAILVNAAWLGHYVGDAHMPFHAIKDYDGKAAGQKGIHAYLEIDLVDAYVQEAEIKPVPLKIAKYGPEKMVFEALAESAALTAQVLTDDRSTTNAGVRDLKAFSARQKASVKARLSKAAARLAALWTSAWIEAGKPTLP